MSPKSPNSSTKPSKFPSASKDQNKWKTIYQTFIEKENLKDSKPKLTKKILSLKHHKDNEDFILVDIRGSYNGRPTQSGICLTQYEFDWMANYFIRDKISEASLPSIRSARLLNITPLRNQNGNIVRWEIFQTVND